MIVSYGWWSLWLFATAVSMGSQEGFFFFSLVNPSAFLRSAYALLISS